MQVPEVKSDVKPVQKSKAEGETDSATPLKKKRKRVTMAEPDREKEEKTAKQGQNYILRDHFHT